MTFWYQNLNFRVDPESDITEMELALRNMTPNWDIDGKWEMYIEDSEQWTGRAWDWAKWTLELSLIDEDVERHRQLRSA